MSIRIDFTEKIVKIRLFLSINVPISKFRSNIEWPNLQMVCFIMWSTLVTTKSLQNYLFLLLHFIINTELVQLTFLGRFFAPTLFYFSRKDRSTYQKNYFTTAFLTKFLTNSWNKIFVGLLPSAQQIYETLRGEKSPRLGGWRLNGRIQHLYSS